MQYLESDISNLEIYLGEELGHGPLWQQKIFIIGKMGKHGSPLCKHYIVVGPWVEKARASDLDS